MPTEKYAHGPEILEHCRAHRRAVRPVRATRSSTPRSPAWRWDEARSRWIVDDQPRRRGSPPSSWPWAPARCTCPSCPASPASRPSRATRSTPAGGTTTTPAATPIRRAAGPARRQAGGDHRHRRDGRAVRAAPGPRRAGSSTSSSARPSSVDVRGNRPIDPDWFAPDRHAGLAAALAGELRRQPDRGDQPTRTWSWTAGPTSPGGSGRRLDDAAAGQDLTVEKMMAAFEDSDFEKMEEIRARVRRDRRGPGDGRGAQGLVPPAMQAAVLPRRVPAGLQPAGRAPGRHRRPGRRADHRDRRGGRPAEYEVDCIIYASGFEVGTEFTRRAGFDLDRPGRPAAVGALGRRHAHDARHPRARLPERLHRAAVPGREPDLQRPAQPVRGGQDDRPGRRARAGRRVRRGRGDRGGRGRPGWTCCCRPRTVMLGGTDCTPGYYNNEGQGPAAGAFFSVGYPTGAWRTSSTSTRWRAAGAFEGLEFR